MDFISHIFFSIIFLKEISWFGIFGAIFPDLDRFYSYLFKRKFFGHESRTWFHDLPFLSIIILFGILLKIYPLVLGIISHIFLDFVVGATRPFYPFNKKVVDNNLSFKQKIILGGIIWAIGLAFIVYTM